MGICNLMMVVVMVMVVVMEQGKEADANKNMLLVARKGDLRKVDLDVTVKYTSEPLPIDDLRDVNSIEYDKKFGFVYWTQSGEKPGIYKAKLDGKEREVVMNDSKTAPEYLAIDILERSLYWTDSNKDTIESVGLDGTNHKVFVEAAGFPNSISLINNLNFRFLYYITIPLGDSYFDRVINRVKLPGEDQYSETLVPGLKQPCCLAIDSEYLYWAEPNEGLIKASTHQKGEIENQTMYHDAAVSAMSVLGKYLYWADQRKNTIERLHISEEKHEVILDEIAGVVGLKAVVWITPEKMPTPKPTTPPNLGDIPKVITGKNDLPPEVYDYEDASFQNKGKAAKEEDDDSGAGTAIIIVAVLGALVDVGVAVVVLYVFFRSRNAGAGGGAGRAGGGAGPRPNM